ncbi:MAG: hypothetical protein CR972_04930 [Candidatus Moraniibacteriota bacterium]|nr:MAG: hypothetical protein CR972_04930 [Candidatus Moranbacteria bacterium]
MIIVLEGVDCSGKSSVAKHVASTMSARYYPTPPARYMKERERIDAISEPCDHYRFYLNAMKDASRELSSLVAQNNLVIVDRYWMSTFVYHRAMGVNTIMSDFSELTEPSWTFYLCITPETQSKRFKIRGMSVGDRRTLHVQSQIRLEYERLIKNVDSVTIIKSDQLSICDVSDIVIKKINDLK